jgi:hypothetical protein
MYLGRSPRRTWTTEENGGLDCCDDRRFRDRDEQNMTDQALAMGFVTAALVVLAFYLSRRLSRCRRRIVFK